MDDMTKQQNPECLSNISSSREVMHLQKYHYQGRTGIEKAGAD
jgi:hypothetical protein